MTANTSGGGTDPAGTSLYGRELVGPYDYMCNTDGSNTDMESCLGIAELKGGGYSITGTKPEDSGRELRGTSWTTPKPATVSRPPACSTVPRQSSRTSARSSWALC